MSTVRAPSLRCALVSCVLAALLPALARAQEPEPQEAAADTEAAASEEPGERAPGQRLGEQRGCRTPEDLEGDRVVFDIPLTEEQGGGRVTGSAAALEFDGEERALLSGAVHICYKDIEIRADSIELETEAEVVKASGHVEFDQKDRYLSGASLELDLQSELGVMTEATAFIGTDYFFEGDEIAKVDADVYTVENGVFTSCEGEKPAWSFKVRRATVTVDGYAKAKGASMRAKNAPVFYLPYVLWPVRDGRTSGFLVPKPGYSSRRGASLGLAYYQVMGRSYDTTFLLDLFSGGAEFPEAEGATSGKYLGLGNEFRYRPSEGTNGIFRGYAINDPQVGDVRWRLQYDHESRDLPAGLRAVIAYEDVSDFEFFEDFDRSVEGNTRRQLYSNAFVTGNWGPHSMNVLVDSRETFVSRGVPIEMRQLPEIEYRLRSTQLGRAPLYLQLRSSLHYFDVFRNERNDNTYGRAHFLPEITLPLRAFPWLSVSFTAGGLLTWYEDSLLAQADRPGSDTDFSGESLTRTAGTARAEIVGPSFSRIFDGGGKRWAKFKHLIEPRINWAYVDQFDEQDQVPIFDEIDPLNALNIARFSFVNRLMGKPPEEEGSGGAREIMSLELFQDYSFDSDRPLQRSMDGTQERQSGPIGALLRYNPSDTSTLRAEVTYSTLFQDLAATSLSSSYGWKSGYNLGLRWTVRRDPERMETLTHQVRLSTRLALIRQKLTLNAEVNYDVERQMTQLQRYLLDWKGCCYGIALEVGEFRGGTRRDLEYRLTFTLKNVGSFLEINGADSNQL